MTGAEMKALIQRVEKAEGPDRELDADIALATGWERGEAGAFWREPGARLWSGYYPNPTASLDAAVSLVPEGKLWVRLDDWTGPMEDGTAAPLSSASVYLHARNADGERLSGVARARTPALALCAAALRALLAMEGGDER